LYIVSLADGKIRPVGGSGVLNPAWSPNGRWIAVDGIHLLRPNGQRGPTITHPPANGEFNPDADVNPDWAPDGGRLAFMRIHWICPRCDEPSLWIIGSRGAKAHQISGAASDVSWSPDGRRLAVATPEGLLTMRSDGSGTRVVSRALTDVSAIDWGPARK
jgi:Tol biopolymer transport system component